MTKFLMLFVIIFMAQFAFGQYFNDYFQEGSLRFDYYRTGNHATEIISNDVVFKEPFWGGSQLNLLDTFNFGNYRFEVYDSVSNKILYSRGFSSLFFEWRFTPEAKSIYRSFSETVVFPLPKNTVKLVFYMRNTDLTWNKQYETFVNPKHYSVINQPDMPLQSFRIHGKQPSNKALDVVLLAEGYTDAEMQKFMNDAHRFAGYLLKCSPFDQLSTKINIWAVPVASAQSGTDIPGKGQWVSTFFDSHFYTFGTERYLNTLNNKKVRSAAANVPYDQIYILVNSDKYGGAGIFNYYSICTSDHKNSDFVFVHEFGHAMAGLGDEYYTSDVSVENFYNLSVEPWEPNLTTLNDFNSKWKSMVDSITPIPTPVNQSYNDKIGAFEGGGYFEKGVYRPSFDCTMKSVRYNDFCEVCVRSIIDMIEFYAN